MIGMLSYPFDCFFISLFLTISSVVKNLNFYFEFDNIEAKLTTTPTDMKPSFAIFLRTILLLIGIGMLLIAVRFPLLEGRAKNLDLISVYADPFILYGYACLIPFFLGLYKVFQLLGYLGNNQAYSVPSIAALKTIRHCAIVLAFALLLAGMFIRLFHHKDDDPAGFLAICMLAILLAGVVAVVAARFQKKLQKGVGTNAKRSNQ
jgi:hypothetical protein